MTKTRAAVRPTPTIRVARPSDVDALLALTAELGYSVERSALRKTLSSILGRPRQRFFVAEAGGRVVAWLHVAVVEYVDSGRFAMIAGLVVGSSHRRLGIGRSLMRHAEDWGRAQGCSIVRLWSSSRRRSAHRFYDQLGYTRIKTQYAFAKPLLRARRVDLTSLAPHLDRS